MKVLLIYLLLVGCAAYEQKCSEEIEKCTSVETNLERARCLSIPEAVGTQNAEFENDAFWDENGSLLQKAWREFETERARTLSGFSDDIIDEGLMDVSLSQAIDNAFASPCEETESTVKSYWTNYSSSGQILPKGVYATKLLSPAGVSYLRQLLDLASESGIPTRRPNGMNRYGVILDRNVEGAVPLQGLTNAVEQIVDRIVRPVGRLLYQNRIGCEDDVEYYAFTITYEGASSSSLSKDVELKEHRDASVVTLNVNLNLPEEDYGGSEVFFRGYPNADDSNSDLFTTEEDGGGTVTFSPGTAVIHLGAHRHGSMPIKASTDNEQMSGKRMNLVIWLFGKHGDVRIAPYAKEEQLTAKQRWHDCNGKYRIVAFNTT